MNRRGLGEIKDGDLCRSFPKVIKEIILMSG